MTCERAHTVIHSSYNSSKMNLNGAIRVLFSFDRMCVCVCLCGKMEFVQNKMLQIYCEHFLSKYQTEARATLRIIRKILHADVIIFMGTGNFEIMHIC